MNIMLIDGLMRIKPPFSFFLTVEEWSHRMGDVGRVIAQLEGDFG